MTTVAMPFTLLLIEDSPDHAELVRRAFAGTPDPVKIVHVESLEAARDHLCGATPNLILSDLQLPDGSAIDLLASLPGPPPWPLIVMTGQGDENLAVLSLKSGAVDYLVKSPETVRALPGLVSRAWREWQMGQEQRRMQSALRESEARFRSIFDESPVGVAMFDLERRYLNCNAAMSRLLGYSEADLMGRRVADFTHPEDREKGIAELGVLLAGRRDAARYQKRYVRPDGNTVWAEVTTGLVRDEAGAPRYYISVVQDVTARRQAEEALRVSEERLRLAMEATSDGLWDWDLSTGHVYWSGRTYAMLGYETGEFPLTTFRLRSLVHPDDRARIIRGKRWKSIVGTDGFTEEFRLRTKSGGYKWIISRGKPVAWDADGHVTRMVGTHVDIDERIRYEISLEEKNQRLHALFDEANDAIIVTEIDTMRIAEVNAMAERLLGRPRASLIGSSACDLHPREGWPKCERLFEQAGRLGAKVLFESEVITADSRRVPVEISANRISLPGGRLVLQGIFRDLSERRQLEAQLRQAQKMEAIGQLAGGVAHDFNNVLAAIMLQLGLLQNDKRLPAEMHSTLSLLEASTKRASDLTRQLLLFGRRQPAKVQSVDLDLLVANLLKMLRRLVGETIQIGFSAHPNHHWVQADPGMIEQVIMNMVVNARDAMPSGGKVAIRVDLVERERPAAAGPAEFPSSDYVCLAISDSGTGIDDATKRRLFEPFFTTKELGRGTGLGLATAYSIVKQHSGWIEVESELGEGTCFKVFLPFHNPVAAALHAAETHEPPKKGHETILLVEDDNIVRTFTGLSLRSSGYSVLEADDGPGAREVWSKERARVNLVLTDMIMPHGVNGWDLVTALRQERPSLAVVIMSGYTTDLPPSSLDPANRIVFLQKPFDAVRLTHAIREALDKVAASAPAPSAR